jgi:uncharacterized protein (DUF362 family)
VSPYDDITRRDFLQRAGKAAGLSALMLGGGFAAYTRERHPFRAADEKPLVRDLRIKDAKQEIVVVHGEDPDAMTRAALAELGGMGAFIAKGDRVVIKPNIGWDRNPEQAANTNPEVVRALVRECLAAGAARVVVTDVTCNQAERCFQRSGIAMAAKEAGAIVELPVESRYREMNLGGKVLGRQRIDGAYLEADKFINVPIAKHHSLTGATLGLKNLYGILGGNRSRLHQAAQQGLADLGNCLRPTLTVLDAYRLLRRNGPSGGNLADVEQTRMLAASPDMVALDAWAADTLFHLDVDQFECMRLAEAYGVGRADYTALPLKDITV